MRPLPSHARSRAAVAVGLLSLALLGSGCAHLRAAHRQPAPAPASPSLKPGTDVLANGPATSAQDRGKPASLPARPPLLAGAPGYRVRQDYIGYGAGFYDSSHGFPADQFERVEVGLRHKRSTLVLQVGRVHRFGLVDGGVDSYFYQGFSDGYWGYLYLAYHPDSVFLARTAYGAEIDRDMGAIGWSLGYRHLVFSQDAVALYIPGATYYLTDHLSLTARVFYFPAGQSHSVAFTSLYQDARHDRYYVTLSAGNLSVRSGTLQDFQRHSSNSAAVGVERRLSPSLSAGTDLLYEHRAALYDRHGIDVYLKTWW